MEFTVDPNTLDVKKALAAGKKYRVIYERPACIGAAACVAVFDKRWEMAQDNKANLKGGWKIDNDVWILDIDDLEYEDLKTSGEVCPVNVIHVFKLETGEKVI
ncbi:MAG: ferredoxin [DPANN group archaeon]|nr:ferredoxin [DPANN group archaeon]